MTRRVTVGYYLWPAILLLCACQGGGAPRETVARADAATVHASVATAPAAVQATTRRPLHKTAAKPRKLAPPDPRIVDCTKRATDKASLMACLDALKGAISLPEPDAGHKLGAVRPPPMNPAWAVPFWYINESTGNDGNTCVSSGSPCHDFPEITARWGGTDEPILTSVVTIIVLSDITVANFIHWRPTITNTGDAILLGGDTVLATTTISGLVAKNRNATGAYPAGLLQANIGGTAADGMKVINASRSNSVAWVDSVASGVATLTQPMASNVATSAWAALPAEFDNWANGDTVTVNRPVKIYLSTFDPVPFTTGSFGADDFVGGFIGDVWVKDSTVTSFPSSTILSHMVMASEIRTDPYLMVSGPVQTIVVGTHVNCWMGGGGTYLGSSIIGGSLNKNSSIASTMSGQFDGDVIVHGDLEVLNGSSAGSPQNEIGNAYFDNSEIETLGDTFVGITDYSVGIYGNYELAMNGLALVNYDPPATATFLGTGIGGGKLTFYADPVGNAFGTAVDYTVDPAVQHPARALTPLAMDTSVAAGGFGGIAYGDQGAILAVLGQQSTAAPVAYLNAGTGITLTPNSPGTGQLTISSSVTGGVSSVTASGAGITASPTTGAVVIANTGATSVTGAGSNACSPTTGGVTCTVANTVPNGLTGGTSFPNGAIVVGQNTSALSTIGPGAFSSIPYSTGSVFTTTTFGSAFSNLVGSGTNGQVVTQVGGVPVWASLPAFSNTAFQNGSGTLATSLSNLAALTITTGAEVMITVRFEFASGDNQNDAITYGETTDATTSIVAANSAITLAGTTFGAGTGIYTANYMRILHLSGLTPGSHTFNFLAQLSAAFGSSAPNGEAEVIIKY
jgi:hypothetical protein